MRRTLTTRSLWTTSHPPSPPCATWAPVCTGRSCRCARPCARRVWCSGRSCCCARPCARRDFVPAGAGVQCSAREEFCVPAIHAGAQDTTHEGFRVVIRPCMAALGVFYPPSARAPGRSGVHTAMQEQRSQQGYSLAGMWRSARHVFCCNGYSTMLCAACRTFFSGRCLRALLQSRSPAGALPL